MFPSPASPPRRAAPGRSSSGSALPPPPPATPSPASPPDSTGGQAPRGREERQQRRRVGWTCLLRKESKSKTLRTKYSSGSGPLTELPQAVLRPLAFALLLLVRWESSNQSRECSAPAQSSRRLFFRLVPPLFSCDISPLASSTPGNLRFPMGILLGFLQLGKKSSSF